MRRSGRQGSVRWFAVVSSATAPVLLIGGWTLAAALQPAGFDSLRDTISALAGHGATHRWVMTVALLGVGLCHCITALGLRPLATPARVMLAAGGAATVLVAAFPLPDPESGTGSAGAHQLAATVAFACLALWPALSRVPGSAPQPVPPALMRAATGVLVTLVVLFCAALAAGVLVGLAERVAAGAQSLWPLTTVLALHPRTRAALRLPGAVS